MNKTSITTLYLYAFLFTLSAWLCDVTITANRSCTLVGCDCGPTLIEMLIGSRCWLYNTNIQPYKTHIIDKMVINDIKK